MEIGDRKVILSASRREDLPGCAPERLLGQLESRELRWRHPFNQKEMTLRFEPSQIFALALWSKDFGRILGADAVRILDPLRPVFLFTINDCPELEPGLRSSLDDRVAQAELIVRRYGKGRLFWRYDPFVHWVDAQGRERSNVAGFIPLARRMARLGVDRVVFSFAQLYAKLRPRERELGIRFVDPALERKRALLADLAGQAAELGIGMLACCQPELLDSHPNVGRAACIDGPLLRGIIDADPTGLDESAHPSRPGCGCTRSIDVGSYAPCGHGCAYCYANRGAPRRSGRPGPVGEASE